MLFKLKILQKNPKVRSADPQFFLLFNSKNRGVWETNKCIMYKVKREENNGPTFLNDIDAVFLHNTIFFKNLGSSTSSFHTTMFDIKVIKGYLEIIFGKNLILLKP